ncbi:MAG: MFS transporter [Cellulomonas sp.]
MRKRIAVFRPQMDLSSIAITAVFAIYAVALLLALLTLGSLSDHVGRKPVIIGSIALPIASMVVFIYATDVDALFLARALQGVATGAVTTALAAGLTDLSAARGQHVNGLTPPLIATTTTRESAAHRGPGAVASLRIPLGVPHTSRAALLAAAPMLVALWAIGGFTMSRGPALADSLSGSTNPSPMLGGSRHRCGRDPPLHGAGLGGAPVHGSRDRRVRFRWRVHGRTTHGHANGRPSRASGAGRDHRCHRLPVDGRARDRDRRRGGTLGHRVCGPHHRGPRHPPRADRAAPDELADRTGRSRLPRGPTDPFTSGASTCARSPIGEPSSSPTVDEGTGCHLHPRRGCVRPAGLCSRRRS